MIPNLRPRTRRGWVALVFGVVTFAILDVLALLGSEFATEFLIYLAGGLIGAVGALALTHPLREKLVSSGGWRLVGIALALASVFGVVFLGTRIADIPYFPTAEGGNVGTLIFGSALGVAVGFGQRLNTRKTIDGPAGPIADTPQGSDFRVLAVVVGAVAALFAVFFVLYLLLEFVAAPLIRALAA